MKLSTLLLPTGHFVLVASGLDYTPDEEWCNSFRQVVKSCGAIAGFISSDPVETEDAVYDENAVGNFELVSEFEPDDEAWSSVQLAEALKGGADASPAGLVKLTAAQKDAKAAGDPSWRLAGGDGAEQPDLETVVEKPSKFEPGTRVRAVGPSRNGFEFDNQIGRVKGPSFFPGYLQVALESGQLANWLPNRLKVVDDRILETQVDEKESNDGR